MKKLLLIFVGLAPVSIGYLQGRLAAALPDSGWLNWIMVFIFPVIWFFTGWVVSDFDKTPRRVTLYTHIPAAVVLILLLIQGFSPGGPWDGVVGIFTRTYYLPVLFMMAKLADFFSTLFNTGISLSTEYIAGFALMLEVFYLGAGIKVVKRNHKPTLQDSEK